MEGERHIFLIGDSGYPIQPWMMTPIPDAAPNTPEGRYTARHCSARNIIERAFGVLKQRFKCLLKHRTLHYNHAAAGRIIYSCVVLHNICRINNIQEIDVEDHEVEQDVAIPNIEANDVLTEGRWVRRMLINEMANEIVI